MKRKYVRYGVIVTAVLIITAGILLFSGPRMKYQPSLKTFESALALPPDDAVSFYEDDSTARMPEVNIENLNRGKIYYDYYCVFCHGENGKGNGPVGESYVPKPADLTSEKIIGYDSSTLYNASFTGTGHTPVLDRVIDPGYKNYIILYIKYRLKKE